jgi:hypothetical protein
VRGKYGQRVRIKVWQEVSMISAAHAPLHVTLLQRCTPRVCQIWLRDLPICIKYTCCSLNTMLAGSSTQSKPGYGQHAAGAG